MHLILLLAEAPKENDQAGVNLLLISRDELQSNRNIGPILGPKGRNISAQPDEQSEEGWVRVIPKSGPKGRAKFNQCDISNINCSVTRAPLRPEGQTDFSPA